MTSFALICEGITDQVALESILYGHYQDPNLDIHPLQPIRDETDESRQGNFGGWEKVLEYCSDNEKVSEALHLNDFLIIQIDADIIEHEKFDVRKTDQNGNEKSVAALINDIVEKINNILGDIILEKFPNRVLYAICVYSLECWILPIKTTSHHRNKTKSCEIALDTIIKKSNGTYEKTYDCYQTLTKGFEKNKNLTLAINHNESLRKFIESLPEI
ncbi:hypothetical protein [Chromobacterium sp. Beijing]|uniref:hypothetical protein n=1 Tax=Chromobacterium sp. Beijing TaxID=2735795 RepID=UPI001F1B9033|nr:hypothetical protein [Chromobacterium sp. Beijing]UJB33482.1 hypothetical protein HQN78_21890 [Chromobacterium sp. Beijing]